MILVAGLVLACRRNGERPGPAPTKAQPTDPVAVGQSTFTRQGRMALSISAAASPGRWRRGALPALPRSDLRPRWPTTPSTDTAPRSWTFEARAWNLGYRDQKYTVDYSRVGRLSASFMWDQIPLFISRDTRTLLRLSGHRTGTVPDRGPDSTDHPGGHEHAARLRRPGDAVRSADAAKDQSVRPGISCRPPTDLADVKVEARPRWSDPFRRHLRLQQRRRAAGAGRHADDRFPVSARVDQPERTPPRRMGRLDLRQCGETVVWDNPLRFGPDMSGTPSQGREALWPDNSLYYVHGTGAYSLRRAAAASPATSRSAKAGATKTSCRSPSTRRWRRFRSAA